METPILRMSHISKRFDMTQALDDVSFDLCPGEIHALLGENGAGKSTLIKIACGVHQPDDGEILFDEQAARIANPRQAQELGIATIHQHVNLYPDLSVLENNYMGRQLTRGKLGLIDWRRMQDEAKAVLESMGVPLNLHTSVGDLSTANQQMVEIAKVLSQKARVLIMDEPTPALSHKEIDTLFAIIRRLRDQGVAIIYISHRLDEVFELADRVTVIRDGRHVGTHPIEEVDYQQVISMMIGRPLAQLFPKQDAEIGEPILQMRGLRKGDVLRDITMEVRQGEIVGLTGLVGSGRTELALALFGIAPPDQGEIEVDGKRASIKNPWDALALGIAYLPEDRHRQGIVATMKVKENVSLAILESLSRVGFISLRKEKGLAKEYVEKLAIRTPSIDQQVANLSGGNQQKVVVAKWLASRPRVLILDEPTQGIDVGTKAEIHRLMSELAGQGMCIIMISSELPEILGMSDRILIMRRGSIVGELDRDVATKERIMALATGAVQV
jgi:ABC-type sugar transport system ATPase subunit